MRHVLFGVIAIFLFGCDTPKILSSSEPKEDLSKGSSAAPPNTDWIVAGATEKNLHFAYPERREAAIKHYKKLSHEKNEGQLQSNREAYLDDGFIPAGIIHAVFLGRGTRGDSSLFLVSSDYLNIDGPEPLAVVIESFGKAKKPVSHGVITGDAIVYWLEKQKEMLRTSN